MKQIQKTDKAGERYFMTKLQNRSGYMDIFIAGCMWGSIGLFVNILSGFGIASGTAAFIRIFT